MNATNVVINGVVIGKVFESNGKWQSVVFTEPYVEPDASGVSGTKSCMHPTGFDTKEEVENAVKEFSGLRGLV